MRAILAAVRLGGKQSSPDVSPTRRHSCPSIDGSARRVSSHGPLRRTQSRPSPGYQRDRRRSEPGGRTSPSSRPGAERWTAEERATYVASLNLARLPVEASVQRFLEDALATAKLPAPWTATRDESGRLYFSNWHTLVSSWYHPLTHVLGELADICRRVLSMPEENRAVWIAGKRSIWKAEANESMTDWYVVPRSSGRKYYYHRETQDTMWENPAEVFLPQYHLKIYAVARLAEADYVRTLLQEEELLTASFSLPQAATEEVPPGMDPATFNFERLQEKFASNSPSGPSSHGNRWSSPPDLKLVSLFRQFDAAAGEEGWQEAEAASFPIDGRDQAKVEHTPHADILLVSASRQGTPPRRDSSWNGSQSTADSAALPFDQEPGWKVDLGEGMFPPSRTLMPDDQICTGSTRVQEGWQEAEGASFPTDGRDQAKVEHTPHADILLVSASRQGTPPRRDSNWNGSQSTVDSPARPFDQKPGWKVDLGEGMSRTLMLDDLICTGSTRVPGTSSTSVPGSMDAPRPGTGRFNLQRPLLPLVRSAATRTPPPEPPDQDLPPTRPMGMRTPLLALPGEMRRRSCEADAGRENVARQRSCSCASLPAMPLQRAAASGFRTQPPSPPGRSGTLRAQAPETCPSVAALLQATPAIPQQAAPPPSAIASTPRGAAQVGPVAPVPPPAPRPGTRGLELQPPALKPPDGQDPVLPIAHGAAAWAAPEPPAAAEPPGAPVGLVAGWAAPRRSGGVGPRPGQLPPKLDVLAPPFSAAASAAPFSAVVSAAVAPSGLEMPTGPRLVHVAA